MGLRCVGIVLAWLCVASCKRQSLSVQDDPRWSPPPSTEAEVDPAVKVGGSAKDGASGPDPRPPLISGPDVGLPSDVGRTSPPAVIQSDGPLASVELRPDPRDARPSPLVAACEPFQKVVSSVACETCMAEANRIRCAALWDALTRRCGPSYDCGTRNCLCLPGRCRGEVCSCIAGCLPIQPDECHTAWIDVMRCLGDYCAARC